MANYTVLHMTPGLAADCYLAGCAGVSGGLCVGAPLTPNNNLWWCCTPYEETCRGNAQTSCDDESTHCSFTAVYSWCCNSTLEKCPSEGGVEGSCIPISYENPAKDGPVWGPGALSTSSTASSTVASSTASVTGTAAVATVTVISEAAGMSTGAAAGVGVMGGALGMLAIVGAVYFLRRRKGFVEAGVVERAGVEDNVEREGREQAKERVKMVAVGPVEVHGHGVHEMGTGSMI